MTKASGKSTARLLFVTCLFCLLAIGILVWALAESAGLNRKVIELEESIVAPDQAVIDNAIRSSTAHAANEHSEFLANLAEQIVELERADSEIVARLETIEQYAAGEDRDRRSEIDELALIVLEKQLDAQNLKLRVLLHNMEELTQQLEVPDKVAGLTTIEGLTSLELQKYHPFFELRQELEQTLDFNTGLQSILASEEAMIAQQSNVWQQLGDVEKGQAELEEALHEFNPPREVADLHPSMGLAKMDLQEYWPYFETKLEIVYNSAVVNAYRARIAQEQIVQDSKSSK